MQSTQRARQAARPAGFAVQTLHEPARTPIGLVAPPAAGLRARQLLREAKKAALEHVGALQSALIVVQALLDDIIEGDDIYGPGLGEFAGRLREDLFWRSKNLESLAQKQRLQVEGSLED